MSMRLGNKFLEKVKSAVKESKHVEFKEMFDVTSDHDWCEITKDIVALANSGGGCILIGVRNDGTPVQFDPDLINKLDSAKFVDKIFKYTFEKLSLFEIIKINRNAGEAIALLIGGLHIPVVFQKPGTYDVGGGRQETAFKEGTVYFRHSAKSEPANSNDLRDAVEREISRRHRSLIGNLRKVVEAPADHVVQVGPPAVSIRGSKGLTAMTAVRYTDDPSAPLVRYQTADDEHPLRQKDVVRLFNERMAGKKSITSHDILCVRKVHNINETKPLYYYKPRYRVPTYSSEFVDWLVQSFENDSSFFDKARALCGTKQAVTI